MTARDQGEEAKMKLNAVMYIYCRVLQKTEKICWTCSEKQLNEH